MITLLIFPLYVVGPSVTLQSIWDFSPEPALVYLVLFDNFVFFLMPFVLLGLNFSYLREFERLDRIFGKVVI